MIFRRSIEMGMDWNAVQFWGPVCVLYSTVRRTKVRAGVDATPEFSGKEIQSNSDNYNSNSIV